MPINKPFSESNVIALIAGVLAAGSTRIITGLYCTGKLIIACPTAAELANNGSACSLSDDTRNLIMFGTFAVVSGLVGQFWPRSEEYVAASVLTHPEANAIITKINNAPTPPPDKS
jgi:hypothetical protein